MPEMESFPFVGATHSLASNRTPLVMGVAATSLVLGTAAAWPMGWVAGLGQPNRLLLALLFLVVAVKAVDSEDWVKP